MNAKPLLRLTILALAALVPTAASACSCSWFFEEVETARLRAVADRVEYVAAGEIVAATEPDICTVETPIYRTLRIDEAIKGEMPSTVEIRVGTLTPAPEGCAIAISSCDVRPGVGARGVWALERTDAEWTFAMVCETDAVRRVVAADRGLPLDALGGEADAVRRRHGSEFEERIVEDIFGDSREEDRAVEPKAPEPGPDVARKDGGCPAEAAGWSGTTMRRAAFR